MSSNTKVYEDKMKSSVEHLSRELAAVRAGRANPAVLDKVVVDYYGAPTPLNQVAAISSPDPRSLMIQPWDSTLLKAIEKAMEHSRVTTGLSSSAKQPAYQITDEELLKRLYGLD